MGRTIVIGDIHGCFDELKDLLELCAFQGDDRVVAVGDLIVKGAKSREVLDLFIEDRRFSSVVGNHDRALRQYWRGEPIHLTRAQQKTCAELESGHERYANYLRGLPYFIDLRSHLVVHAGVRPGVQLKHQMARDLTELRTMGANPYRRKGVPWYRVYTGPKTVVFGHWPSKEPRRTPHAIGLDTGCVYGGHLSGFIVEENRLVSVPARRVYDPRGKNFRQPQFLPVDSAGAYVISESLKSKGTEPLAVASGLKPQLFKTPVVTTSSSKRAGEP